MRTGPDGQPQAPSSRKRDTQTVLLVDDETSVLDLCRRVLERSGFHALCFDDPHKALELFQGDPDSIDALVSDVVMPGMSGPELADALIEIKPALRVLFISGIVPDADHVFAALKHEFPFRFLRKPFSPALLVEFLRDMLQARSAGASSGRT